ncbi:TraM recognition domain-containing protein, partial [Candidatus Saccharibacteria bacterium]|nr:TraM recognition domain-containing protein [Candidatus Saccharibacteria bacterium]
FCLYVDEFQNFATESFETILSEARKYRLNLILGNQFISQLTEKIREAIIGNVGTVISGRIGQTDAELLEKKFNPPFDEQDLTNLPNHESVAVVQIAGVPSAPFSMSWVPPMGHVSKQLEGAMKRLSAAKYGKPRAVVEKEIFARIKTEPKKTLAPQANSFSGGGMKKPAANSGGPSFLDEWLEKRKKINATKTQSSLAKKPDQISKAPENKILKPQKAATNESKKIDTDSQNTLSVPRSDEDETTGEVHIKL